MHDVHGCVRTCTDILFILGIFSLLLYRLVLHVYILPPPLVFGSSSRPLWAGFGLTVGGNLWVYSCWRVDVEGFPLLLSGFGRGFRRDISVGISLRETTASICLVLLHPLGLHQWCIIYLILLYLCMFCIDYTLLVESLCIIIWGREPDLFHVFETQSLYPCDGNSLYIETGLYSPSGISLLYDFAVSLCFRSYIHVFAVCYIYNCVIYFCLCYVYELPKLCTHNISNVYVRFSLILYLPELCITL